jgi:hypothetical protein
MLGTLIYLVVTVAAGFLLGFVVVTLRSTKKRGEGTPFPIIIVSLLLCVLGPFIYVEALTKLFAKPMEAAVKKAFEESPLNGKLQYFRVTSYSEKKATALAVIEERASWGGTDRPVMKVSLEKENDKWKPTAIKVIYSDRLNKDGLVIPPYR